jgi:hypothetical protein
LPGRQGFTPHYLDRTFISSHAQGMPRCRLVRPLRIPCAGDGTGFPRESFQPGNQSLEALADYSLSMILVATRDVVEFCSLPGGPLPIAAEWGRIAEGKAGPWFRGSGLSRANSTLSWAATDPTAWRLTDLSRSKADAVETGWAVDPPPLRRDNEMSRADEYPARQFCRG